MLTPESAQALIQRTSDAAAVIRTAEDDVLATMGFPENCVIPSLPVAASGGSRLPDDASILRLVTMLLAEQNDDQQRSARRRRADRREAPYGGESVGATSVRADGPRC